MAVTLWGGVGELVCVRLGFLSVPSLHPVAMQSGVRLSGLQTGCNLIELEGKNEGLDAPKSL